MQDTPLLALDEVAERLNVHIDTLRRAIRAKKLEAYKISGQWRVSELQLERYRLKNLNVSR